MYNDQLFQFTSYINKFRFILGISITEIQTLFEN